MPRKAEPLTRHMVERLTRTTLAIDDAKKGLATAIRRRDIAIRHARNQGASLRAIADVAGLTHSHVANIVDEEEDQ